MGVDGILQNSENVNNNLNERENNNSLITPQAKRIYQNHISRLNSVKKDNTNQNINSEESLLKKRDPLQSTTPSKFMKIKETSNISPEETHSIDIKHTLEEAQEEANVDENSLKELNDEDLSKITNYGTVGCICLGELDSGGVIVSGSSSGGHSLKHPGRIGQVSYSSNSFKNNQIEIKE